MDTRLLHQARPLRLRITGRPGALYAAGLAAAAVILAGVLVLILDGNGVSWLAGLLAGAGGAAWLTMGRRKMAFRSAARRASPQRRTRSALEPLGQAGWSFVHDVPGPDGAFDHIAVGPGGLILLQSLSPDGVVRMIGSEPVVEPVFGPAVEPTAGGPAAPPVRRLRPTALADAITVRERVQGIARRRMWVQAVVVFWSEFPAGCVADGRCVYIHGSRLAEWLSRRPNQFDAAEAEAVSAAVHELAERGTRFDLPVAV